MTVTEKSSRKIISGSGWVNPLTHDYMIENASYAHVFADEVELVQGVDYVVSDVGVMAGYVITIVDADAWTPDEWVLDARPPIAQGKDLTVGGVFGAKFEDGLDQLARRLQRVYDVAMRGLKFPLETEPGDEPYELPLPVADTFIGWNGAGTELESKTIAGLGLVVLSDDGTLVDASHTEAVTEFAAKTYADTKLALGTAAALPTKTISASVDTILTSGYDTVGDDGEDFYNRVGAPPARAKYITDLAGQHFAITSRTIKMASWGLFPDTANPHLILKQMIDYLMLDKGGGELQITHNEEYDTFLSSVTMAAVASGTLHIWNKAGGVLKAATGLALPLLDLRPNASATASPENARLKAYGLKLDNSLGTHTVGAGSSTGLHLTNWDRFELYDFECVGGYDPIVGGVPAVGGDSGLSTVGCRSGTLVNPNILNQPDAGIYPSWDNTGDEGGDIEVIGGTLALNKAAVTAKRNLSSFKLVGTLFDANDAGATTQWVNNGGWVEPCKKLEVIGCTFRRGVANHITAKRNTKLIAIGNTFEDPGYLPDGTGGVGANARVVNIRGTTGAVVRGNTFRMRELASDLEYAFSFLADSDSGVTYDGGSHDIGDNIFENWYRHSVSGTNDAPSIIGMERVTAAMEADSLNGSDVCPTSRYEFVTDAEPRVRKVAVVQTIYRQAASGVFPPATIDLTALGVLAAGATTALQTLPVTGLVAADSARIDRLTANLSANPDILISSRTIVDAVQYYFKNNGAVGFDFTSQSIRISF